MAGSYRLTVLLFGLILWGSCNAEDVFTISPPDISLEVGGSAVITLSLIGATRKNASITLGTMHSDLIRIDPMKITLTGQHDTSWNITLYGLAPGHVYVYTNITPSNTTNSPMPSTRVTIEHSAALSTFSVVVGWTYFVAWSISFYPQIYENWKRKSVVGLNFDFLSLNIVGFILYSLFNCGLYWIPEVEVEYFKLYPRGLNPVQVNDIVFALHAVLATAATIVQCYLYERGDQKVSWTARGIHSVFAVFLFISLILASCVVITWLDFLYYCSYVKLGITLIKYVPQAYMNYRRKSTLGWSIGNILLDSTGGLLSMLQMILNAYNYDDWESIFGDPTKFGLGLFSVVFDVYFIIQHYVLYRHGPKEIDLQNNI